MANEGGTWIMKGLDWAWLYDKYGKETLDTAELGKRISALMRDSEIQRQQGIIPYVLTGDEHYLDLRAFPEDIKLAVWEKQNHICLVCGKEFDTVRRYAVPEGSECCCQSHAVQWGKRKQKE